MELLIHAFNPATIDGLMCRNTISVGWRGEVYDCDFNQQLGMQWSADGKSKPLFLWDIDPDSLEHREIMTVDPCFGCTSGAGSSCGGAISSLSCWYFGRAAWYHAWRLIIDQARRRLAD